MTELGLNIPSLVAYLINFVVLLGILLVFAYKPLISAIDQRAERIKESLEAADKAQEDAESSRVGIQAQINEARVEAQKILDQARTAAERFRQDEMTKAQEIAMAFQEQARLGIQNERNAAIQEIKIGFGILAIDAAEAIVKQTLDAGSHEELINRVLEDSTSGRDK
jgi:F-type H+-transporting ATPase subunit b